MLKAKGPISERGYSECQEAQAFKGRKKDATVRAGFHQDVLALRYFLHIFSASC